MTVEDVKRGLEHIKACAGDPEGAHGAEDKLWGDVLESIALGTAEDPQEMAGLAVTSAKLDFPRWCA